MQSSRWEKSGCAEGRKDFASRYTSSKAGHLPLPTPPAKGDSPAQPGCWAGCGGLWAQPDVSLLLLHNRCKIWVKKSTCFRGWRVDWSIPGLRRCPKSQEPSQHCRASHKCLCAQCLWAQILFKAEPDTVSSLHLHHAGCHTRGPFSSSGLL